MFRIWGAYIRRGLFLEGVIFGGVYFWRDLLLDFYGISRKSKWKLA